MSWIFFAALTACFESLKDLLTKRATRTVDAYALTWGMLFLSALMYLPVTLLNPVPEIGPHFWWVLAAHSTLLGCAMVLYVKALESTDVSLCIPLVMFTPLFLLVTSPIMVGEVPSWFGMVGVLLIVSGSYVLNLGGHHYGYFGPFRALLENPGARLMLLFSFFMSITANLDKLGVRNSSPYFWMGCLTAAMPIVTGVIFSLKHPRTIPRAMRSFRTVAPAACANTLMAFFHITAISMGLVVYVVAVKRMSAVFSVLGSSYFFKEQGLAERLIATLVMLAGVVLIAFS